MPSPRPITFSDTAVVLYKNIRVGIRVGQLLLNDEKLKFRWRGGMLDNKAFSKVDNLLYTKNYFDLGKVIVFFNPTTKEVIKIWGFFYDNRDSTLPSEFSKTFEGEEAQTIWNSV